MSEHVIDYVRLQALIEERLQNARPPLLIGIAGPPASGKSTLAERLVADLGAADHTACYCPMDGFHVTNAQLDIDGLRNVKGRIDTFDAAAFAVAVARLKTKAPFWWPLYSRQRHDPILEGTRIDGTEAAYVIEGNYILADTDPWWTAANMLDLRIFVDASDGAMRMRLLQRHQRGGLSRQDALDKIDNTDMPNARAIRDTRLNADILFAENVDV